MSDLKVYQFGPVSGRESASPPCVKVHYALRYKHLPFEVVNLGAPPQVKKVNARGKLPVLEYDGKRIADSSDIIRFVEERHPEPRLYPQDERERARALMLEDWADESLYWHVVYENWLVDGQFDKFAAEILASIPALLQPMIKIVARRKSRAQLNGQGLGRLTLEEHRARLCESLEWLNTIAGDSYLSGNNLSVADISVAAVVTCLLAPFLTFSPAEVRKRRALFGWYERTIAATA